MSRTGKKPVSLSSNLTVNYQNRHLKIKGPKGELELQTNSLIDLEITKEYIAVKADFQNTAAKTQAGTARQLINNIVQGVTQGFEKRLELVGIGYKAQVSGENLVLNLGYSHPINYLIPKGVGIKVESNTKVLLNSCDKQLLGQTAAEIRSFRPPEPYKGKGIKYDNEVIRRKARKIGKK